MKKYVLLLLTFIFSSPFIYSQKDSVIVGPGVTYYQEYRSAGPWQFDIVVIDLTNPWLKLKSVKAQDRLKAFERTSSMAARNNFEAHRVVAAINGDFYNTSNGEPISTQVCDGQLLKDAPTRLNFAWNAAKKSMMAVTSSSGKIIKGDSILSVTGFNVARSTDYMVLYNSFFGPSTTTNAFGTEVLVNPINGWRINDTLVCIVEAKATAGNMNLPVGKAVLSGHGIASAYINNNLNIGDTVKLYVELNPGLPGLNQLMGGNPVLIRNGNVVGPNDDRHPRTAIGINQDSTKLFFFTVDGRQPGYSVGMNLLEFANYMKEWGVYQGLNLDGGGSTTMVVRGSIVNSPSDPGGERTVSNGLLLVSTAPTGPLDHVKISPKLAFSIAGSNVQFSVKGFDEYYNPVTIPSSSVMWSCDPQIGTITGSGLFTAANDTLTGNVYVTVGSLQDSAVVHITKISSIMLQPNPVILQPGQTQQMTATARDNHNNIISLPASAFAWSVTGGVGTITASGNFTAVNQGTGSIIAAYENISGSVPVEVGSSTYVTVDDYTVVTGYTLGGTYINLAQCSFTRDTTRFISAPSSARLKYSLVTGGTSTLDVKKDIPISGTPDKVGLYVYGDGRGHWLRGEFKDVDNERFLIDFTTATPGIDWTNEWRYIEKSFSTAIPSWVNPNAILTFPVTWMRLYLAETSDAKKDTGSIYFDDFRVHFVAVPVELTSFSASVTGTEVTLSWTTSSETNNLGFEIQRSRDKAEWLSVGFIKGSGTTTETTSYSYTDRNMHQGGLFYRLKQADFDGSFSYSYIVEVNLHPVSFELQQNYPNPFNPSTVIKFNIPDGNEVVTLKVFDVLGNEIANLLNEQKPAGSYEIIFDARKIPAGVYFYKLNAGSHNQTRKMILLK
jgi:hypothetical protein